jgi:transcriptional regulator with XRE-family HTH domain
MQAGTIDKDWFFDRLKEKDKSLRGLARHMGLDASAVSRMLNGTRRMQLEEADEIARFLGAPVAEVLKHAGVAIDLDGVATRIILTSVINEKGNVERLHEPRPLPQSFIDRATAAIHMQGNGAVIAAQIRADTGPLAAWDDAVALFRHTEIVEPSAIGSLAVCRLFEGEQIIAKIERARKTGEARIVTFEDAKREVMLLTATPVIAVIP